jgi:hypothetical protein
LAKKVPVVSSFVLPVNQYVKAKFASAQLPITGSSPTSVPSPNLLDLAPESSAVEESAEVDIHESDESLNMSRNCVDNTVSGRTR